LLIDDGIECLQFRLFGIAAVTLIVSATAITGLK